MYLYDDDIRPEEEEEVINQVAKWVHETGMSTASIILLEGIKPLSYIGGTMGRFFLSPFFPVFGRDADIAAEKIINIFEKHKNIEKLMEKIEELEKEKKKRMQESKKESKKHKPKTGIHRFIPF